MATSVTYEVPPTTWVWYVKHAALPGLATILRRSTIDGFTAGLAAAFHAIVFLYRFPPAVSHVYSTYSMFPSELISPKSLRTVPVEPLPPTGTTPLENPPATVTGTPLLWEFKK